MLRAIIPVLRKELQFHLAGFPLRIGMLLTLLLAATSTLLVGRDYNLRLEAYRDRMATYARALHQETVYSFAQPVVIRPPAPLSVLDQGFDAQLGTDVSINLFAIPAEATGGYRGNELLAASPAADLTAIVAVVLGLLALLLAHDAIEAEREGSTLAALSISGLRRGTLLAGKLLGGLLSLILPLGAALLVSLAIFVLRVEEELSPRLWLRAAGLGVAYVAYLSLMFLLGLLISLSSRNRSRVLSISVMVWLTAVLVLPGAVRILVAELGGAREARLAAAQRSTEFLALRDRRLSAELRRASLGRGFSGDTAISFASGENRAVRYRYGSAAYYNALSAYYRTEVRLGMGYAEMVFAEHRRAAASLHSTERLGLMLGMISPAVLLDSLAEELAGTSTTEYDRFLEACRIYRLAWLRDLEARGAFTSWRWFTDDSPERLHPWPRFLGLAPEQVPPGEVRQLFARFSDPAVADRVRREQAAFERDPARRLNLAGMPRFAAPDTGLLDSLRRAAPEACGLLVLNLLAWVAVAARFRRWLPR